MKKINEIIDLPQDIIDAVREHGKCCNYTDANLLGYIVEYSYKRAHGIPYKVIIHSKSDGGVDFVDEQGTPWDIKATKCSECFFDEGGYTAWCISDKAVKHGMNYILCRADMTSRKAQVCFSLSAEELMENFRFCPTGGWIKEYLTHKPVISDRDCWLATYPALRNKAKSEN